MAKQRQETQHSEPREPDRAPLNAAIAEQVMHALGQPVDLFRVQVQPLWQDHYRVNVLVGADSVSTRIAHSFFLNVDGKGLIIGSTPKIAKQY
jgi:hypothetical protein